MAVVNVKGKIRKLKRKDRVFLTSLIDKLATQEGEGGLLQLISSINKPGKSENNNDTAMELGIKVVKLALSLLENEVSGWFADLLGSSVDEFNEMPFDIEALVIQQLQEAPEIGNFFTILSHTYSKIKTYNDERGKQKTE
ncbi:MAG: hypothetical protein KC517_09170 [Bacteroidetes bacterium]|nr:hypothetical protein [Bacteroidota bacterium]